jgi:hypothetical protein
MVVWPQDSVTQYKAISWMYSLAALLLRNFYYAVAIKICRGIAKVDGIWGAQRML